MGVFCYFKRLAGKFIIEAITFNHMNQKFQPIFIGVLLLAVLPVAFLIILPYINSIFLATALAVIFFPVYSKIVSWIKSKGWSSFITVALVLLVILIPLAIIGTLIFNEAFGLYSSISSGAGTNTLNSLIAFVQNKINSIAPNTVNVSDIQQYLLGVLSWLISNIGSIFSSVAGAIISFVFSLLILFYLLKDVDAIKEFLIKINPLESKYGSLIVEKMRISIVSVVRGSLVTALLQGIVSGLGFYIFRVPNPTLWGAFAAVAALVPTFGTSLVIVPVLIYVFATGDYANFIGLLIWAILAVSLIDNFIGPHLVKRGTKIHPIIVLLGALGGVAFFGPIGFIMGPMIFGVLFALLEIYSAIWKEKSNEA